MSGRLARLTRDPRVRGAVLLVLGLVAMVAPFVVGEWAIALTGLIVMAVGAAILVSSFRGADDHLGWAASASGAASLLLGGLIFWRPVVVVSGLLAVVALVFAVDGGSKLLAAVRGTDQRRIRSLTLFSGIVDLVLAWIIWSRRASFGVVILGLFIGIRILSASWALLFARARERDAHGAEILGDAHPDRALGLTHPTIGRLHRETLASVQATRMTDLYWGAVLVMVFLVIHAGRLQSDLTFLGLISPAIAVAGDVVAALLVATVIGLPLRLLWRQLTRPLERHAWRVLLERGEIDREGGAVGERLVRLWLRARLAFSAGLVLARGSLAHAVWHRLRVGLPFVALVIGINPIWGFTWYFNTENWASGFWQGVAAQRTDTWRAAMIGAVTSQRPATSRPLFDVTPADLASAHDFSFLVIGDPGEGDASQQSLRDRYLLLAQRPDLKFIVISSDVIYPSGAMKDYEPNFYLPLKGVSQPVFAIPGNHDWFDALDGFAANLFTPDAARLAMRARVDADRSLTSTTPERIERLVGEATRLRRLYGIDAGRQRGPFFELHTPRFSLIAVDTGILRRVDEAELAWMKAALGRAGGRFTMAVLGHPFYTGGAYQGDGDPDFEALHRMLREHDVEIVMAGDTHDFEYYREPRATRGGRAQHHFVNGGGGAYLSIGTALDWPARPAVADWAYYPRTDAVIDKLDRETPAWKRPIWSWVRRFGAWPFSAEALSAVFDFNRAPFFQSFMEVRVEGRRNQVRLILHGVNGPLRWRDIEVGGDTRPPGGSPDDTVEFVIPMTPAP